MVKYKLLIIVISLIIIITVSSIFIIPLPWVNLVVIDSNSIYQSPAHLYIDVKIYDPFRCVDNISFFCDGEELYVDKTPPFNYVWSGIKEGDHLIAVAACDNSGKLICYSDPLYVYIEK